MTTGLVGRATGPKKKKKRWRDRISDETMEAIVKGIFLLGIALLILWVMLASAEYSHRKARCQFCDPAEEQMCVDDEWSAQYVKEHCMWIEPKVR